MLASRVLLARVWWTRVWSFLVVRQVVSANLMLPSVPPLLRKRDLVIFISAVFCPRPAECQHLEAEEEGMEMFDMQKLAANRLLEFALDLFWIEFESLAP